jgi:hypothetical protein
MPCTVASPRPVPAPSSFVVKNGSNARSTTSAPCHAVVGHGDAHAARRPVDADRQRPSLGHRVARVDGEVDEHLLELARVGRTGAMSGRSRCAARCARCSVRFSSRSRSRTSAPASSTSGLTTSRRLNMRSWRVSAGGPVGGAADLLDVLADRALVRQLALGEPDAGQDHREQVVEVVGDAARELADALQPLRLGQALLELGPHRRVARRSVMSVAIEHTA